LLALPELRDDVTVCFARDSANVLAEMTPDGVVRRIA
jgi:hypothetical protein